LINVLDKKTLILHYALITIKSRFKGTHLGFAWLVLEPILIFTMLFVAFTSIRIREEDFAIYLLSGVLFYHIFTRGTLFGMSSLHGNKSILTSLNINREFFVAVSTLAISLITIAEMFAFFILLALFQFSPNWTMILLPIPIILMLILVLGFSYMLSIVRFYFKDIQRTWPIIVHALFFVTPIFWYLKDAPDTILLEIHKFNPMGQIIELVHKLIVFGEVPPLQDWLYVIIMVFSILFIGYAIFKKYEYRILEEM